uniref:Glutaminyl-peptide cyclotransferase n=1 Tax=Aegilops tauschii TaxID=37682 RepID=M8AHC2_AEGTA
MAPIALSVPAPNASPAPRRLRTRTTSPPRSSAAPRPPPPGSTPSTLSASTPTTPRPSPRHALRSLLISFAPLLSHGEFFFLISRGFFLWQGLLYAGNDTLFESTGLYHQSSVRKVDLQTGKVLDQHQMDGHMFGEGLTLLDDRLFQVTWLKNDGFIYDRHNFSKRESFTHKMRDGWGLATDGKILFGSDGTSKLYQLDPISLEVTKTVTVKYQDNDVSYINELEYINGEVWANVWQTDCIARVSHEDGQVASWILLHELRQQLWNSGNTEIDVLNGIAWDEENDRLFVTGKLWPKLYEIKLRPVDGPPDGSVEKLCPRASFYR